MVDIVCLVRDVNEYENGEQKTEGTEVHIALSTPIIQSRLVGVGLRRLGPKGSLIDETRLPYTCSPKGPSRSSFLSSLG